MSLRPSCLPGELKDRTSPIVLVASFVIVRLLFARHGCATMICLPCARKGTVDHSTVRCYEITRGSAEEPKKNRRKFEGNLRECDEEVYDHAI
jgi:hypothetical protein